MTTTRAASRGRIIGIAAMILVMAVVYATVVILYAGSGHVETGAEQTDDADQLVMVLTPVDVDTAANRMTVRIEPQLDHLGAYSDDHLTFNEDITLLVTETDGSRLIEFRAGDVVSPVTVELMLDGYIEQWPLDRYTTTTMIVPMRTDADGEGEPIPYRLIADGRVPGWDIRATGRAASDEPYESATDGQIELVSVDVVATRSGATVAFGVVLLSLMIIGPVLVLTAAVTVLRGRRRVEATMFSWIGAMLFATIPLRNFLPGTPPIGSWVDYLIVLWVIAGLVAGLVLFLIAWLRHGPDGPAPRAAPADPGAPAGDVRQ